MIESPCKDICIIDKDSWLCIGCGRTDKKIANWHGLTDEQKIIILEKLNKRIEQIK